MTSADARSRLTDRRDWRQKSGVLRMGGGRKRAWQKLQTYVKQRALTASVSEVGLQNQISGMWRSFRCVALMYPHYDRNNVVSACDFVTVSFRVVT